jgi:oligopeptide transport system permease protein
MIRFKKNKSSVVAAWIILFLVVFAIVSPIISINDVMDIRDSHKSKALYNQSYPPFIQSIADKNIGIFDGAVIHDSQSEMQKKVWEAIGIETGYQPVLRVVDSYVQQEKYRGSMREVTYYKLENNKYYEKGIIYKVLSYEEFEDIQRYQNESGIQVIYPYVEPKDIKDIKNNANIWYKVSDAKGTPDLDKDGNFVPVYSTRAEVEGTPYYSLRVEGDPGNYIYSTAKAGSVQARICYYNYYQYINGREPSYVFGTDALGRDLFAAIGKGARFSLLFAIAVSVINLTIGAFYGAAQGYYGGWVDMLLDRIADVLYYIPFSVVTTLFQLHLAQKVGVVPSFLFAFVLTGWIGMAALTRKQFYRFKSQEFVMSARTLGASDGRLMFKHIFPNGLGTIITSCALVIPGAISSETSMTYLGIVDLNSYAGATIGTLLSAGQASMTEAPHTMLWPSLFFALLMISFNLFGNGLRDAFNPSTRGAED